MEARHSWLNARARSKAIPYPTGDDMPADASTDASTIVSMRRRGVLVAVFALAACESDPTPIVRDTAANGESLNLAPTNAPGGARSGGGIGGGDPRYRQGGEEHVGVERVWPAKPSGQETVVGYGNHSLFLDGKRQANGPTTTQP